MDPFSYRVDNYTLLFFLEILCLQFRIRDEVMIEDENRFHFPFNKNLGYDDSDARCSSSISNE